MILNLSDFFAHCKLDEKTCYIFWKTLSRVERQIEARDEACLWIKYNGSDVKGYFIHPELEMRRTLCAFNGEDIIKFDRPSEDYQQPDDIQQFITNFYASFRE